MSSLFLVAQYNPYREIELPFVRIITSNPFTPSSSANCMADNSTFNVWVEDCGNTIPPVNWILVSSVWHRERCQNPWRSVPIDSAIQNWAHCPVQTENSFFNALILYNSNTPPRFTISLLPICSMIKIILQVCSATISVILISFWSLHCSARAAIFTVSPQTSKFIFLLPMIPVTRGPA
jgi:hypothetical protein